MCVCGGRRIIQRNEKNLGTNIDRGATHPWLSRPAPEAEVVIRTARRAFLGRFSHVMTPVSGRSPRHSSTGTGGETQASELRANHGQSKPYTPFADPHRPEGAEVRS
jgi:hypothetical protein